MGSWMSTRCSGAQCLIAKAGFSGNFRSPVLLQRCSWHCYVALRKHSAFSSHRTASPNTHLILLPVNFLSEADQLCYPGISGFVLVYTEMSYFPSLFDVFLCPLIVLPTFVARDYAKQLSLCQHSLRLSKTTLCSAWLGRGMTELVSVSLHHTEGSTCFKKVSWLEI